MRAVAIRHVGDGSVEDSSREQDRGTPPGHMRSCHAKAGLLARGFDVSRRLPGLSFFKDGPVA